MCNSSKILTATLLPPLNHSWMDINVSEVALTSTVNTIKKKKIN